MTGAIHGRVTAPPHPYPEFVGMDPLPGRTQDEFRAEFEALLNRRGTPLTHDEYQLAYAVGREMWRACWWSCARARGAEIRREMDGEERLDVARIEVAGGHLGGVR